MSKLLVYGHLLLYICNVIKSNIMKSIKGILICVYRSGTTDCTNRGLSSNNDSLIMVDEDGKGFGCPHTTDGDYLVLVKDTCMGRERLRAIPKSLLDSGKWTMFGGNFAHTSDSRFPSNSPIAIHDRVEN